MPKLFGFIAFLFWMIVGLYFINLTFNFISIPSFIRSLDPGIMVIAGIMLIVGGINYLRANKNNSMQQQMMQPR